MSCELRWDELSREEWEALLARAPSCALHQDWAYGAAVAQGGHRVHRVVVLDAGEPVALAQLVERRLAGFVRLVMLLRGPVWLEPDRAAAREPEVIRAIRARLGPAVLLWTPECTMATDPRCGLRRVMTGYSAVWLDLVPDLATLRARLHGKWRNRLKRAEAEPIETRVARDGPLLDWLLAAADAHRAAVGYRAPEPAFYRRLSAAGPEADAQLVLVGLERGEPVAGMLVRRHGKAATYLVAYTSERGRGLRAHHLLLWRAIALLRDRGVQRFDLGGVDTVNAPGLARFKLGTGGVPATLAGTYLGAPSVGTGR
ncbi:MAG: GNAT family N-acetyltransferase [Geminicoccaceae bacterium]|nr:GNAT family N-acetyltransferase [Geminicoccaceae bacterium]MDW8371199.1 GNAT family N-acetyltransferase [Geminicoccaceae bacterium]